MNPEYYTGTDNTQQVRNYKTATGYYSGAVSGIPTTSTISTQSLQPQPPITPATSPTDPTNYNSSLADGTARIDGLLKDDGTDTDTTPDWMQTVLGSYQANPVLGTGVAEQEAADALAARRAKKAAQAELAATQAKVQSIIDRRDAENLQLEQSINQGTTGAGGAGALASGSFLNVRQQEVSRRAAIEALPLQGVALAQAAKVASLQGEEEYAQSALKAAQDKLDTAFKYQYDQSKSTVDLWNKNLDKIWNVLDDKQKERATALKDTTTRNQADIKDVRDSAQSAFQSALLNGQADLYAQFIQIPVPDPMSKTFAANLQNYNKEIAKFQGQIKPDELKQLNILKARQDLE